jgi:hypothetical protein
VTSTTVGLVETGLKNCTEPRINSGVSGLWLPLLYQNYPPKPLDLDCLRLGQVLQLSTLDNSDSSVHPVHSSHDLTVLHTILCSGARATRPGLLLSRTRILTLNVPSSSPRTLMKRSTGRQTDSLTLLLLGPGSRLTNLEPTPATGGLIVGGPGGHGSTLGLLLSVSLLLLQRFNHELLALPLVTTHHVGLYKPVTVAREGATTRSRGCPGDGTRWNKTMTVAMDGGGGAGQWWLWTARWWLHRAVAAMDGVMAAAQGSGGYGQRSSGARRCGGGAVWSSSGMEVRTAWRKRWKMNRKKNRTVAAI